MTRLYVTDLNVTQDFNSQPSAQEWTNRTLAVHELTSVHFLVLPGNLLSIY